MRGLHQEHRHDLTYVFVLDVHDGLEMAHRPAVSTWDERHKHRAHVGVTVEAGTLVAPRPGSGARVDARSGVMPEAPYPCTSSGTVSQIFSTSAWYYAGCSRTALAPVSHRQRDDAIAGSTSATIRVRFAADHRYAFWDSRRP